MKYVSTELLPIGELQSFPGNARVHDVDALDDSARSNGQYRSVVGRRLPGGGVQLLAGHGTRDAFRRAGATSVRVELIDADDDEALRIVLADNGTSRNASYDDGKLVELLSAAHAADPALAGTGYDLDAYQKLLADLAPAGPPPGDTTELVPVFDDEEIIAEAFDYFRAAGFPYPDVPRFDAMQQINKLALTATPDLLNSTAAYHIADPYQPHRFATPIPGKQTAIEVFGRDDRFPHALRLALESGTLSASSLRGTLGYARNAQIAAQFRPGFALLMYRRFCPDGGTVLDTSTGYGGRLTGFIASSAAVYIGVDPDTRTYDGNQRIAADLCPASKTVELHCLPAEDVPHELVAGRADFAFTSPPYFGKEQYSEDDTQSWKRYPTGKSWRDGFLERMLRLQFAALKPGCTAAVNIADVIIEQETYPLVEWTIEKGRDAGFQYIETEEFPIGRVPGQGVSSERFEPVIILRKPEV